MTDAQLDELEAKAIKGQAFHPLTVRALIAKVRELQRDAEILRTLIYRTHACDLKFNKQGGVSSLNATFKSNTIPGNGILGRSAHNSATTNPTTQGGIVLWMEGRKMTDLVELKAELKWCIENGNRGPRTEAALMWALELVEALELERSDGDAQ